MKSVIRGDIALKIKEGMVCHISSDYFDLVQDCNIKNKTAAGRTYPAYCCCVDKSGSIIWMLPMSTKIEKYKAVYEKEMKRYGHCWSVAFGIYDEKCVAFLIQDMFPIAKKHILHPHTRKGRVIPVDRAVREDIRKKYDQLRDLAQKGVPCILSDIKRAEQLVYRDIFSGAYLDRHTMQGENRNKAIGM